jgi:hypothetical protein
MPTTGPIDKLDIRVPSGAKLVKGLEEMLRAGSGISRLGNKYYKGVMDLQRFGLRSVLHYGHRRNGNHKLQVVGTGMMSFLEILSEINRVFELDPLHAEVMRIDLAVDVPGYSVGWFRHNARVVRKQSTSEYGPWNSRRQRVETLYFGKGANIFCLYDKTAERLVEYRRLVKHGKEGLPSFEALYGYSEHEVVTRVERRYGGGRIPETIRTVGEVQTNALAINPYEPLRFLQIVVSDESVNRLSGIEFLKAQGFLRVVERHGLHEGMRLLDQKTCRNTHRLLTQFENLRVTDKHSTPPELDSLYKEAISHQVSN